MGALSWMGTAQAQGEQPHRHPDRLVVAAIVDEFTEVCLSPEVCLIQLDPEQWAQQLEAARPDFLLIESAWRGKDGRWKGLVSGLHQEVLDLLARARALGIPVAFWNKEDPVHFNTFIGLAKLVDCVFTTDMDSIPRYMSQVGHRRVFLLPFAAQPQVHHPLGTPHRKPKACFAGAYYLKYLERQRDLDTLIQAAEATCGVEIYDRNYNNPHPDYTFPERFQPYIQGTLPAEEVATAYRGYLAHLNLNSIKYSQSMFARRVYELLACGTPALSNFSQGVTNFFGTQVLASDNLEAIRQRFEALQDPARWLQISRTGLQSVLSEHLYAHRIAYVLAKLTDQPPLPSAPDPILCVAAVETEAQARRLEQTVAAQTHANCRLLLLAPTLDSRIGETDSVRLPSAGALGQRLARYVADQQTAWVAVLNPEDAYGPDYLAGLQRLARVFGASCITKPTHFTRRQGTAELCQEEGPALAWTTAAAAPRRSLMHLTARRVDWVVQSLTQGTRWQCQDTLAADEFDYCAHNPDAQDRADYDRGAGLWDLRAGQSLHQRIWPLAESFTEGDLVRGSVAMPGAITLPAARMQLTAPGSAPITVETSSRGIRASSALGDGVHAYVYARKRFTREDLGLVLSSEYALKGARQNAHSEGFSARLLFEYQTAEGKKLSHQMFPLDRPGWLSMPTETAQIRLGLRLEGAGTVALEALRFGSGQYRQPRVLAKSRVLVVTKQYPDYDDLYKYGFLHSRLRAYQRAGTQVDVFRLMGDAPKQFREFEGVNVFQGPMADLSPLLDSGQYDHVLVHMLDPAMWQVLEPFADRLKVTVWVHGAEAQAWGRRHHDFVELPTAERQRKQALSDQRLSFFRQLMLNGPPSLSFVFISESQLLDCCADLEIPPDFARCRVIHNFVDTDLFRYQVKDPALRGHILSVRPYHSRIYANDLAVAAVLELSRRPVFEHLRFSFHGDGPLFERTLAPLRAFPTVAIHQGFLRQTDIADLHRRHGVFLVPSRGDTQGVSRDEAMASGLVPVTNAVAAIPEFVDTSCGCLAPPEDPVALADAIEELHRYPDRFQALSAAAAARVSRQSGWAATIDQELGLLGDLCR